MNIVIHDKTDKTYVVLGAPGSATSLISKALEEQGIDMGNTKGERENFYENQEFEELNKTLLKRAGGSRSDPPSEEDILKADDSGIKEIINKFRRKFWGWKDPQTALTIKKYLPYLEGDVYLVCIFRKPERIQNKYKWYRKGKEKESKELIDRYNESILSAIKEFINE